MRQTIVITPLTGVWLASHVSREYLILYLWCCPQRRLPRVDWAGRIRSSTSAARGCSTRGFSTVLEIVIEFVIEIVIGFSVRAMPLLKTSICSRQESVGERIRLFQCTLFHYAGKSAKPEPQWNNVCRFQSRFQSWFQWRMRPQFQA